MNNKFTTRFKAILPSFVLLSFLFILSFGQVKAATTTFTTDSTWRVTSTNFPSWNTIPYALNASWLTPGSGNVNCGTVQTGVVGAPKIWYPATNAYRTCYFRKKFSISQLCEVKTVTVEIAAADSYVLFINGIAIGSGNSSAKTFNIPTQILQCENVIAVQARDVDAKCWWMTAKVNINTTPLTLTASSNSSSSNPICAGQTLNLTSTSLAGATYAWSGPNGFTSNLQNPSILNAFFMASGVYTVVVNVGKCCRYVATVSVNIKECNECLDFTQKEIICKNGVYYETFCVKNNSTHTATNINLFGVTPNVTYTPNILTPPGGLAPGQTYCKTVIIGGSGAVAGAKICFSAMLVEIKQCQLSWFCVSKDSLCLRLPACPIQIACDSVKVNFNPNTINLCLGDSVQLNPNTNPVSGLNYLWIPATGLSNSTIKNPWAKPLVTTTYNLIVSVPNSNCKKDASITVVVKQCPPPCQIFVAVKDSVIKICRCSQATLSASSNVSGAVYNWTPTPTIISGATSPTAVVSPLITTIYTVTATDTSKANCRATATVRVEVSDCGTVPSSSRMASDNESSDEITIAPNPTQSVISVQIPDSFNWKSATLINSKGVILNELERTDNAKSVKFDVQSQPSGMYIISVKTDKGFVNKKVMKD